VTNVTWSRRSLLRTTGTLAAGAAAGLVAAPAGRAAAFVPAGRPVLTHGVQSGDAVGNSAYVWTRADRTGRMLVEVSQRPDLRGARRLRGPLLTGQTDFTGKLRVTGLHPGERVYYRVVVEGEHGLRSAPLTGSLLVPGRRDGLRFVWTADINGQGWGINPDLGGMRIFRAMAGVQPDFYLCSGDTVYSDGPIAETQAPPEGGPVYRNLTTPEKSKVAETLAEYRGQFAYNLLDENLRAFAAHVPQVNQWDDHEVLNNWYPGEILDLPQYTEKRVDVLAARARQAFFEWVPVPPGNIYRKLSYGPLLDLFILDMRTYKDPNDANTYADPRRGLLGIQQREWLIRELSRSRATWKVIANDLPLGLVVPDGAALEGVAQGDGGVPLGRELEFAEVLRTAHRRGVTGIVFLTADVHYAAAHHYDPARAAIGDFTPFWEFVAGPANAGAFGPNTLDGTFGPQAVFVHAPPVANTSPAGGYQHFGQVDIDAPTGAMTVRLRHYDGEVLFTQTLSAR
jgi:alkaline phosphatase D